MNPIFHFYKLKLSHYTFQTQMKKNKNLYLFYSFEFTFHFVSVNCFTQSIPPQELHFIKDYQTRNFYNSQVILSELDFSKKIIDNPFVQFNHQTYPGCDFRQQGASLFISNNEKSIQQSFINLGKIFNYSAIDLEIEDQKEKILFCNSIDINF